MQYVPSDPEAFDRVIASECATFHSSSQGSGRESSGISRLAKVRECHCVLFIYQAPDEGIDQVWNMCDADGTQMRIESM